MKHKLLIVIAAAAALLLLVGGIAWAADRESAAAARQPFSVIGDVVSLDDDLLTVETEAGEEVGVLLTDEVYQWLPGEPPTTTLSLAVGDPVLVLGRPAGGEAGQAALTARLILIAEREELARYVVRGRVVAVTRQTIVVQTGQRERAITVTRNTRLLSTGGRLDSLREVHPGDQIIALGQPTEFGQWVAGLVLLPDATPLARFGLRGTVSAKDEAAGTLIVETEQRGEITVVTDDETRYRIPGVAEPGFDDLRVGDRIAALGRFEEGSRTRFLARGIGVTPLQDETERP